MIEVRQVEAPISAALWDVLEPWIAAALDVAGAWTADDYKGWIDTLEKDLWVVFKDHHPVACATTQTGAFPRLAVLNIDLIGGDLMDEWLVPLFDAIEEFARGQGCHRVMSDYARRGWTKTLAPLGWTPRAVIIAKDLS